MVHLQAGFACKDDRYIMHRTSGRMCEVVGEVVGDKGRKIKGREIRVRG